MVGRGGKERERSGEWEGERGKKGLKRGWRGHLGLENQGIYKKEEIVICSLI